MLIALARTVPSLGAGVLAELDRNEMHHLVGVRRVRFLLARATCPESGDGREPRRGDVAGVGGGME